MTYKKLSDAVAEMTNPQRSDTFIKEFKNAVREGKFDAAYLSTERFELPKQFNRRGERGEGKTYSHSTRQMIFEVTPAYEQWFEEKNRELAATRRGGTIKPTLENIEAGLIDFRSMAEQTRNKMQSSYTKGQALGKTRVGNSTKKK